MQTNGHASGDALTAPPLAVQAAGFQPQTQPTSNNTARAQLYRKIARVYEAVKYVQKDKRNSFHGYSYASEAAIKAALHEAFAEAGLILLPPKITDVKDEIRIGEKDKQTYLTTIRIQLAIADIDTGETVEGEIYGRGIDNQDKGIYKALTGALKYWLTTTFLIATGDDPEQDDDPKEPPRRPPTKPPAPRPEAELRTAAGIDTGGNPVGTQAAADHVRDQKLAKAAAAKSATTLWKTFGEAKQAIMQLREKVGETAFLREMAKFHFQSMKDFDQRNLAPVVELYHALMFLSDGEVM